jgi:hypothetical protein
LWKNFNKEGYLCHVPQSAEVFRGTKGFPVTKKGNTDLYLLDSVFVKVIYLGSFLTFLSYISKQKNAEETIKFRENSPFQGKQSNFGTTVNP